jgi:hypothetical protein
MKLRQIIEGRDAPLYHGTQMPHLLSILKNDTLDKGIHWGRPGEPDGVRLTRSLSVARSFAEDREFPGGVLVLDQSKLVQKHRMVPYRDVDSTGAYFSDEAEEVVVTEAIQPLSRYMTGIYVTHEAINMSLTQDSLDVLCHEYPEWFMNPDEVEQLLLQLSRHPLRKDMDSFMSQAGPR